MPAQPFASGIPPTSVDIAHRRLLNQRLAGARFEKPEDVVGWLGAVQAQDYAGAKWALGQRLQAATDGDIDRAFADGSILRTHLMRPTWHFVTPADIRWILELTAPRVNAANASYYRQLELDDAIFARSNAALAKALQGGKQLTRSELASTLRQAGIAVDGLRLGHLMMRAELDAVICSGPRRGKQFTYMLLDERAPQARTLARDEALAELTRRYFTSHGPATEHDFAWWSGLTLADVRAGLKMAVPQLLREVVGGQMYWFSPSTPPAQAMSPTVHLLPNYDEFTVAYKDRGDIFDPAHASKMNHQSYTVLAHTIVVDGQVLGTWNRTFSRGSVVITSSMFAQLTDAQHRALTATAQWYGEFLGMPAILA